MRRLVLLLFACGCGRAPVHPGGVPFDAARAAPLCFGEGTPLFDDVTAQAGSGAIHHIRSNLPYYLRNLGGGVVMEDLDGDGDLDLYVSNGDGAKTLLLNHGDGTFDEAAAHAGADFPDDWTHGVSAADFDDDGDQDLLLLNRGQSRLLRNRGDATFEDVTDQMGLTGLANAAGASWADLDGDGKLDLLIAVLADGFSPLENKIDARASHLYRNDGTRFVEVATPFPAGSSYIAPLVDLDDDGRVDLLLTEEFGELTGGNHLYRNQGGWSFEDVSAGSPIVWPYAPMGAAVLDLDADGHPDLFMTNLWNAQPGGEVLVRNAGQMSFSVASTDAHAITMSLDPARTASWGTVAFDLENDGDDDLYVVYGHLEAADDFDFAPSAYPPLRTGQPNALLRNTGGAFELTGGTCAEEQGRGRGVAAGDLDGDGCLDLYVVNEEGPARQLRNRCDKAGRLLELRLTGTHGNRDAVGAKVQVTAGGRTQVKWVLAGSTSVFSAPPKRLYFGLGNDDSATVKIRWPDGVEQTIDGAPVGVLTVEEP